MNYTFESLVGFISRNDEHKEYYIEQLRELIQAAKAEAWAEGYRQYHQDIVDRLDGGTYVLSENPYRKER